MSHVDNSNVQHRDVLHRDVLSDRAIAIQRELVGMTLKQARLSRAIADRKTALARLEASAVLGAMLPARPRHE